MIRVLSILLLSLVVSTASAAIHYRVMGFYPQTAYGDYVIVYGYQESDGRLAMSHCRTNALPKNIYSNKTYLDIDTCTIKVIPTEDASTSSGL